MSLTPVASFIAALTLLVPTLQTHYLDAGQTVYTHNSADGSKSRATYTALGCEEGVPHFWRPEHLHPATEAHELAHAWHCEQTGNLYDPAPVEAFPRVVGGVEVGAIPPRPATWREAVRLASGLNWYCWSGMLWQPGMRLDASGPLAEAEWFACMVDRAVARATR